MSLSWQTCYTFTLILLLQMSIHGTAFIISCPSAQRFAQKSDFGTKLQFSRLSLSTAVHLIPPKSRPIGERRSCSRERAMKDDYSDPTFFRAKTNEELDHQPTKEWNFVGRAISRLSNVFDAMLRFVWTSFHRLLVVRFIWLMQTTASLKSVLLDSTRSFSSSKPQVQKILDSDTFHVSDIRSR
jgi:hypothetical protein